MIPSDCEDELIAFVKTTTTYSEKTGKITGKLKQGTIEGLCPDCSKKFTDIIQQQQEKGMKVL